MSFIDTIKSSVLDNFSGSISVWQILLSVLVSFGIAIYIIFIYKKTYTGIVYSKSFSLSIILLAMVTSLVITTINSNLALSLGMVGALSIVRFRTAVKEPVDTIFMFWAIAAGIMSGAGLYIIALIASLFLGILFFLAWTYGFKKSSRYLLVLKYEMKINDKVESKLEELSKKKLRSKAVYDNLVELTFEVDLKNDEQGDIVNKLADIKGVKTANLINYQTDFSE